MTNCTTCQLCQICLPAGMRRSDVARIAPLVRRRVRLAKGDLAYRSGDAVRSVYAVRAGMLKTHFTSRNGREKVVGFHLPGEIVGLDSLATSIYPVNATALEVASLCEIPVDALQTRAADTAALRHRLIETFGESSRRERELTAMLVLMSADERVAAFLLELSGRLSARGYAASEFLLRMTRDDIGNYLGLKLETISRVLKRLARAGLIAVRTRHVVLLDKEALQAIADGDAQPRGNDEVVSLRNRPQD